MGRWTGRLPPSRFLGLLVWLQRDYRGLPLAIIENCAAFVDE